MTAKIEDFRLELRTWFEDNIDLSNGKIYDEERALAYQAGLFDAGFLGATWPVEFGGRGLGPEFQTLFNEEFASWSWAFRNWIVTIGICASLLLEVGTPEQKSRHIPRMLRGDEIWAQLLSEPGAGSDLASVSTRAVREGGEFVLNGQKVWTSDAHNAHFALALVRTDPELPKYQGMSMLIVDMRGDGVDIRPLREMTGRNLFNEVFIDDHREPVSRLVGELNDGWTVQTRMLHHERMALSTGTTGARMDRDSFRALCEVARDNDLLDEPEVRRLLADVFIEQRLMDFTGARIRRAAAAGIKMGPVGSIAKMGTAHAARTVAEAGVTITGLAATAWHAGSADDRYAKMLLSFPMKGIAGGTTEIQKNIVAERVLGLPREERPDKDMSFKNTKFNGHD